MIYYGLEAEQMLAQRDWMPQAYVVLCLANGKVYNGIVKNQGCTWQKRVAVELGQQGAPNKHYLRAIQKYGRKKFHTYLFAVADTVSEIIEVEKTQILETRSYLREYGYNKTMGGEGVIATAETRALQAVNHAIALADPEFKKRHLKATIKGQNKMWSKYWKLRAALKGGKIITEQEKEWLTKIQENRTKGNTRAGLVGNEKRKARRPEWTKTKEGIQEVLLVAFPKQGVNPVQMKRATRWRQVIRLYFEENRPYSKVALTLGASLGVIKSLIRGIVWVAAGKRASDGKPRSLRPAGRPKGSKAIKNNDL
jgi:hypothetical protein